MVCSICYPPKSAANGSLYKDIEYKNDNESEEEYDYEEDYEEVEEEVYEENYEIMEEEYDETYVEEEVYGEEEAEEEEECAFDAEEKNSSVSYDEYRETGNKIADFLEWDKWNKVPSKIPRKPVVPQRGSDFEFPSDTDSVRLTSGLEAANKRPFKKQVSFYEFVKCEYYCVSSDSSIDEYYEGEETPRRVKKTLTLYEDYLRKAVHISPLRVKKPSEVYAEQDRAGIPQTNFSWQSDEVFDKIIKHSYEPRHNEIKPLRSILKKPVAEKVTVKNTTPVPIVKKSKPADKKKWCLTAEQKLKIREVLGYKPDDVRQIIVLFKF